MKENLGELFDKFSKDIETVHFNGKDYYYLSGDDSTENFNFKLLLCNGKILFFKDLESFIAYLKNSDNIFDPIQTKLLAKTLEAFELKVLRKCLDKTYEVIDIGLLQKELLKPKIDYKNIQLYNVVFSLISLLKDYFHQINDEEKFSSLNSKEQKEFFDIYFNDFIFTKNISRKTIHSLKKVLELKEFKYHVKNFAEYICIYNEKAKEINEG